MSKQTYNTDWEDPQIYPNLAEWITKGRDNTSFCCKVCNWGSFKHGWMGIGAPLNHMKPSQDTTKKTKHERNMSAVKTSHSIASSFSLSTSKSVDEGTEEKVVELQRPIKPADKKCYGKSQAATKAEIILAMKSVVSHISARSMDDFPDLLRCIFPDSAIAKQVQLHRTKLSYLVNHGLAPYYKNKLMNSLKDVKQFVSCFDESFNRISNRKQLDLHIIHFDETSKRVQRNYIGSAFFGHGDAESCLNNLLNVLDGLDFVNNLVQVGMDGPNVNWKLLTMLREKRAYENPQSPKLLELGSCGIHVLHGAYNTAQSVTTWNLGKVLKSFYSIFKKSPARRSDYMMVNDLHSAHEGKDSSYLFPLKFCGHRWLENGKAITRIIEIAPYAKTYMDFLVKEKKIPKNDERFEQIKLFLADPVSPAILQFALSIMKELEPFLELFQAERPLSFFLYEKLKVIILSLVSRFVRPEEIEGSNIRKLMQLDFSSDSSKLLPNSSVDIGFGANDVLKKFNTLQSTAVREFQINAKTILAKLLEKLAERSPLKYKLTLLISSLSPIQISVVSNKILQKRYAKLLELLCETGWVSPVCADRAKAQYSQLLGNEGAMNKMEDFNILEKRVDEFYMEDIFHRLKLCMPELKEVLQLCLIISHGNARVESVFSINEQILQVNMKEKSMVAQRILYDGITNEGGPEHADINNTMLKFVSQARGKYELELKDNKKKQTAGEKKREDRKRISKELNEATAAKKTAIDSMKDIINSYDAKIDSLKKKL